MERLFNDDARTITDILKSEWSLGIGETPQFYYDEDRLARTNIPGSIYCYEMSWNSSIVGINYDGSRRVSRITIDMQNPENRERHNEWVNEVLRILNKFRRAGKYQLNGWDYMEPPSVTRRTGYTKYYHSTIEVTLVREVKGYRSSGFGNLPLIPSDACDDDTEEQETQE